MGASCHNAAELAHAEGIGVDFVVLSPIKPTSSHPDAEPLTWKGFAKLTRETNVPVYALGGMILGDRALAWRRGGQGIAGIRGLWAGESPSKGSL